MRYMDKARKAAEYITEKMDVFQGRAAGLVLGSGLGAALRGFRQEAALPYSAIPGFPRSTVAGHDGRLLAGTLGGRPLLVLSGRVHLYEGHEAAEVCLGVRVLRELGVNDLILTNAAGALNPRFETGTLMCLADHINLTGHNPLRGPHDERWGERFPDMSRVYDEGWRRLAARTAQDLQIDPLLQGDAQVLGPSLETPAETRAFRALGADAVGMSTAVEAVAARQMGMRVLGISCLTNKNLPDCMGVTTHAQVLAAAEAASGDLGRLLAGILKESGAPSDETRAAPPKGRPRGRKKA